MIFSILKRDLKRKKTMNTILLIFMILSVMFVSSSVNTMLSVSSATDDFLKLSGAKDYFVAIIGTKADQTLQETLDSLSCVKSYQTEHLYYLNGNALTYLDETVEMKSDGLLNCIDDLSIRLFDQDKQELTHVAQGDIYIKNSFLEKNNISVGSKITITLGGYSQEFTVRGAVLDALFGSAMTGTPRFVISRHDFDQLNEHCSEEIYDMLHGTLLNIETEDPKAVENAVSGIKGVAFTAPLDIIKLSYIMDLILAGVFLIVSVCLITIALVLLKFTVGFTISEEYREIGVMKAIGIRNGRIRSLYMVKYLALAFVGAIIGFGTGIPFGNMMTAQSMKSFITNTHQSYWLNLVCSLAVVGIIAFFCWLSTSKVSKFTPVDAIRNGESGKRYQKKGLLSLAKSPARPVLFMAVNDILSGFRHYVVMTVTFIVGILLITITVNTISTLQSPKLLQWFSMVSCDIILDDNDIIEKFNRPDGQTIRTDYLNEMEQTLAGHNIPAECYGETIFKFSVQKGDHKTVSIGFIGCGTTTDQYAYLEGTPPQNPDEVALSYLIADKLDARVGDTVTIRTGGENEEFIVSALLQSMNNMGEGIRFHEKLELDFSKALSHFGYQIRYSDHPSASVIESRNQTVQKLYPDCTLRTASEYVDNMIGGAAGAMGDTKNFIILIVMMINILVVVLMEKSFLTKERGQISLMKAIGFSNRTLILWQTIRIALLMAVSVLIAVLLTEPCSQLAVGGIFQMMGAKYIIFDVNLIEAYLLYPLAVLSVTVLAAMTSSLSIRNISSQEVNNIE